MAADVVTGYVQEILHKSPNGNVIVRFTTEAGESILAILPPGDVKQADVLKVTGALTKDPGPGKTLIGRETTAREMLHAQKSVHLLLEALGCTFQQAEQMVASFPTTIFKLLETAATEEIATVKGVDSSLADYFSKKWLEYQAATQSERLLSRLGLSRDDTASLRASLGKNYHDLASALKVDPYLPYVLQDTVPFKVCDQMAKEFGIGGKAKPRLEALIVGALREACSRGDTYQPKANLTRRVIQVLGGRVNAVEVAAGIDSLVQRKLIVNAGAFVYLNGVRDMESALLARLGALDNHSVDYDGGFDELAVADFLDEAGLSRTLAPSAAMVVRQKLCIVDGGNARGRLQLAEALIRVLADLFIPVVALSVGHWSACELNRRLGRNAASTLWDAMVPRPTNDAVVKWTQVRTSAVVIVLDAHLATLKELNQLVAGVDDKASVWFFGRSDIVVGAGNGRPFNALARSKRVPVIEGVFSGVGTAAESWFRSTSEQKRSLAEAPGPIEYVSAQDAELGECGVSVTKKVVAQLGASTPDTLQILVHAEGSPAVSLEHLAALRAELNRGAEPIQIGGRPLASGDPLTYPGTLEKPALPKGSRFTVRDFPSGASITVDAGFGPFELRGDVLMKSRVDYVRPVTEMAGRAVPMAVLLLPEGRPDRSHSPAEAMAAAADLAETKLFVLGSRQGFNEPDAVYVPQHSGLADLVQEARAPCAAA